MNPPVKPIDSWSRGIRCRRLVEPNFESLHATHSIEMEVSSTRMLSKLRLWPNDDLIGILYFDIRYAAVPNSADPA
ncbi:unnamed protein product [Protopolystoma xenopodis]|uniref:Uncharacterized protein n=1 Tax=Protopolystoma xenopodis TaxID=117903 RepID=A0A3S5ACA4_9PLAT|nr:unnamed protein product [Protopolystoma xenopodis]